ncbi:hypothetical protein [Anaerosolibacter sp.]|nr:hypothetical protein [Anaerosolibacter sp.]
MIALVLLNGFRKNAYGDGHGNLGAGTGIALFLVSGVLLVS